MNSYEDAKCIERDATKMLLQYLRPIALDGQLVINSHGPAAEFLQKNVGDVILNNPRSGGGLITIDIKSEAGDRYGNFFLEMWSNRKWRTPGWMWTLNCDLICFVFVEEREAYFVPFEPLRVWAIDKNQMYRYQLKQQRKRQQLNDTWGYCVPISVIMSQVDGCRKVELLALAESEPS